MYFCFFNEWFQVGSLIISVSNPTLIWAWRIKAGINSRHLGNILLTAVHLAHLFEAQKTYVYKYETTLIGGMQEEKLAKSGLNFSSNVLISAESGNIHLLKVLKKHTDWS